MFLDALSIEEFTKEYLHEVQNICDSQFGKDYLNIEKILSFAASDNLGLIALDGSMVIGFSFIKIGSPLEISNEFLCSKEWVLNYFEKYKKIALRQHLALKKGFENHGIGTVLMEKGMKILKDKSVDAVFSIVWKEGAHSALDKMLKNFGSFPIHTIINYWKEDSIEKKYICPYCKDIPCRCSAIIYSKSFINL